MTRYEYIKSLNEKELAQWLCETLQLVDAECENCPAYRFCYRNHNGMKHWLLEDETQKTFAEDK